MAKTPTNLSLHPGILELADELMKRMSYSSLSNLVEELVREEYERRNGPMLLHEQPGSKTGQHPAKAGRVSYRRGKKKHPPQNPPTAKQSEDVLGKIASSLPPRPPGGTSAK